MPRKKSKVYTKCLARSEGCSLWLAEDHVMHITGGWSSSEMYRRFYFRDFQAVLERSTNQRTIRVVTVAVLLHICLAFGALISFAGTESLGLTAVLTLAAECLIVLPLVFMTFYFGRTLLLHFRTATQQVQITAIHNQKVRDRVMREIEPRIAAAQREFDAENLVERAAEKNRQLTERSTRRMANLAQKPIRPAGPQPVKMAGPGSPAAKLPAPGGASSPSVGPRPSLDSIRAAATGNAAASAAAGRPGTDGALTARAMPQSQSEAPPAPEPTTAEIDTPPRGETDGTDV